MEFEDDENTVSSKDPWQFMYFEKGAYIVTLDGDFTLAELKEVVARVEHYGIDSK